MVTFYLVLKMLHIVLAIAAVGFTSTFGITMATTAGNPTALPFALTLIRRLSSIATPCLLGLIVTGLLMGWDGNLQWTALWFAGGLALALVVLVVILTLAKPTLRRQLELVKQSPPPLEDLRRLAGRSRKVGAFLSLMALTIIGLMIFKPTF